MNILIATGHLGQDPEARVSSSGVSLTTFSLAVNSGYGDKQQTNWLNCVAFGKTGEAIVKYCRKGSKIAINGELEINQYEDRNHVERTSVSVKLNSVEFLSPKTESGPKQQEMYSQPRQAPRPQPQTQNSIDDEIPF